MKYIVLFFSAVLIFVGTGCSKVEDPCIETESAYFVGSPSTFTSCSDADYVFWILDGKQGEQGRTFKYTFSETGVHEIRQIAYSDDARKEKTTSMNIDVGHMVIDSVVFTRLLMNEFPPEYYDSLKFFIGATYSEFLINQSNTRKFVFNDEVVIKSRSENTIGIMYIEPNDNILIFDHDIDLLSYKSNPIELSLNLKYDFKIYWHLGF
tara:strand:- start:635 stop:1258 length:624 start_codon:yes stop_codon:yes gene_type:complete